MGETNKQVRVDNWGIFFLQRLQLFFNKTDYCDLTLQFEGNVQLKVHRLVMNACTEYFNVLEQTCEVIDGNTVIMPQDLQADVILPIVNFMYTGMLEFQMSIFDKLYHTAELMSIPVLTKLLDAQKKPIAPLPKLINKKMSSTWNLQGKKITPKVESDLPMTLPGRKLPVWKRKMVPNRSPHTSVQHFYSEVKSHDPLSNDNLLSSYDNTPKPTRFEWPEDEISSTFNMMDNSFDDISYTSKPLLTQDDELRASTSFDDMKHQTVPSKKSKEYGNQSIDMEEVKNYVKEQKIRSDINDYDDEDDPDTYLDSYNPGVVCKRKPEKSISVGSKRVRFSVSEKENKETKINVTPAGKASDVNHTKIISEVLKKYPHLVKKNKNIRLKILAKSPTKSELQKAQMLKTIPASKLRVQVSSPKGSPKPIKLNESPKNSDEGPWTCSKCSTDDEQVEFVLYYLYRKHMTDVHNEKFDSRMCKFCGHQSSKHNMLMYHQYTRHGIKPPAAYNFPKCNRCPYIALTENLLIKHKLNHTKFDLQCIECKVAFNSQVSLSSHMQITGHSIKSGRNSYDCQYCTKRYQTGSNLFSHIKMLHRDEARRDGIVSIDESEAVDEDQDDNDNENDGEEYTLPELDSKEKVKIISNIKVPPTESEMEHAPDAEMEESTDSINNMATSLGLVDIVVLENDQQFILHNDQQLVAAQQTLTNNQSEYILPEISDQRFAQSQTMTEVIASEHNVITQSMLNNSDIASTDELVMVLTDHDYNDGGGEILTNDNSNIVVLYSHPVDGQQNQFITSQGNLMLNSETGMLEIRNDAPGSATQETQIESIELIQREINSHNELSSQHPTKDDVAHVVSTDVATISTNVEPVMQTADILENRAGDDQIEMMERHEDVESMKNESDVIHTEVREETVETMSEDGDDVVKVEEVPMEIDEDCGVFESNEDKNEHNSIIETIVMIDAHNDGTPSEIADTCEETPTDEPQSNTSADVENSNAIVETPLSLETERVLNEAEVEEDRAIEKSIDADTEPVEEDKEKNTNQDNSKDETPAQEPAELNVGDDDTAESITLNEKGIKPEISLDLLGSADEENHEAADEEKLDESENLDNAQELNVEADQKNTEEHECELRTEIVTASIDEAATEVNETQSENVTVADAGNKNVEDDKDEVDAPKCAELPDGEAQTQNESDEAQNPNLGETETETEDKIILDMDVQCDDKASSDKDGSEAITENVEPSAETFQADDEADAQDLSQNESLEEMEVEDSSMDDDNSQSQDSQVSRSSQNSNSSKLEAINVAKGKDPSQSMKISILDDWEDTEEDSQQSDIARRKAERTVHKLIDDWDDDEEDDDEDDDDEGQT